MWARNEASKEQVTAHTCLACPVNDLAIEDWGWGGSSCVCHQVSGNEDRVMCQKMRHTGERAHLTTAGLTPGRPGSYLKFSMPIMNQIKFLSLLGLKFIKLTKKVLIFCFSDSESFSLAQNFMGNHFKAIILNVDINICISSLFIS